MTTITPVMKQSLIVLGAFMVTAGITFATMMLSQDSSGNYLKSSPYVNRDTARDTELRTTAPAIVTRLDAIVTRVSTRAQTILASSGPANVNTYLDGYLARLSALDDLVRSQDQTSYNSAYVYMFTYLYPRVYALKINTSITPSCQGAQLTKTYLNSRGYTFTSITGPEGGPFTIVLPGLQSNNIWGGINGIFTTDSNLHKIAILLGASTYNTNVTLVVSDIGCQQSFTGITRTNSLPSLSATSYSYGPYYGMNVTCTNGCGSPSADTTAPTVPTGVTAVSNAAGTGVTLSWTASTDAIGVTGYKVYGGSTLLTTIQSANLTTYLHSSLTPGTTYSYTVVACDAANNCSAASTVTTVQTSVVVTGVPSVTLSVPTSSASSPISFGAIGYFTWNPVNVTRCIGYSNIGTVGTNSAPGWLGGMLTYTQTPVGNLNAVFQTNGSQYPFTLPPGVTTYSIECWNAAGVSTGLKSGTVYVATGAPVLTSTNVTGSPGNFNITWSTISAMDYYTAAPANNDIAGMTGIKASASSWSVSKSPSNPNNSQIYYVRACIKDTLPANLNSTTCGSWSSVTIDYTPPTFTSAPSFSPSSINTSESSLFSYAATNAGGGCNISFPGGVSVGNLAGYNRTVVGSTHGVGTHIYSVICYSATNIASTPMSATLTITPTSTSVTPGAPTITSETTNVTSDNHNYNMTWTVISGLDYYTISAATSSIIMNAPANVLGSNQGSVGSWSGIAGGPQNSYPQAFGVRACTRVTTGTPVCSAWSTVTINRPSVINQIDSLDQP